MFSKKITFFVFTHNEENRLEDMLKSLKPHANIVVVDNHSTDNTVDIANSYTDRVYKRKNIGYVENEKTMKFVMDILETEWAYLCYVDEYIPADLMSILKSTAENNAFDAVEIYRKNFMYGREVFNYGKHHLRMFRKGSVDFTGNIVHRLGVYSVDSSRVLKVPVKKLTSIWHMSAYNTDCLEKSHNRYANLEAIQRNKKLGQKFSGLRAIWKLVFFFFGTYIGLGGFRGGWPGFFISVQIAYFKFSIEARLWEKDNNVDLDSIANEHEILRNYLYSEND
jgi:glycosyltransferase involved in cell wall biosynthesis